MNRFQKSSHTNVLKKCLGAAIFLLILFLFISGLSSISRITENSEAESLKKAIMQSAVHCYATEGFYPDSLDYLMEHYGISYDSRRYIVSYEITGSNLMPDVDVIPRVQKEGGFS